MSAKMILAIVVAVLSVLIASTAQLSDLFGPAVAKTVVTIASLLNSLLASISAVLSTQSALVKDVQAMPGVSSIQVTGNATLALAQMAVDPANAKIDAAPGQLDAVKTIVKQG